MLLFALCSCGHVTLRPPVANTITVLNMKSQLLRVACDVFAVNVRKNVVFSYSPFTADLSYCL